MRKSKILATVLINYRVSSLLKKEKEEPYPEKDMDYLSIKNIEANFPSFQWLYKNKHMRLEDHN